MFYKLCENNKIMHDYCSSHAGYFVCVFVCVFVCGVCVCVCVCMCVSSFSGTVLYIHYIK